MFKVGTSQKSHWGNKIIIALLFALILSIGLVVRNAQAESVTWSGILRDASGLPEVAATVSLLTEGNTVASTETAEDGSFTLIAEQGLYGLAVQEANTFGQPDGSDSVFSINSSEGTNPNYSIIDLSSGSITQDLQLPALATMQVSVTDAQNEAIADIDINAGQAAGDVALWTDGPLVHAKRLSAGEGSTFGSCKTNASGQCTVGSFIGAGSGSLTAASSFIDSSQYDTPEISSDTQSIDIHILSYALIQSSGTMTGKITTKTPIGTKLENITTTSVWDNVMSGGAKILSGKISYQLTNLAPGSTVTENFNLPNQPVSAVYMVKSSSFNSSLYDITENGSISGSVVSLNFTDGGNGDLDGEVNGVIDHSLAFVVNSVPVAPTNVTAVQGNGSALVSWVAPLSNGGGTLTGYVVTPYLNGVAKPSVTFNSTSTTQTVTGLTNGQNYTFTVAAINAVGTGAASAQSAAVKINIPLQPTNTVATPGNARAVVSWSPTQSGTTPPAINGYIVTPYIGTVAKTPVTFNSTATTQTITGLTNGQAYTFKVTAKTVTGTGPQSNATNAVTVGSPLAPTNPVANAGNGRATVQWTASANNNGSTITGYVVTPYLNGVAKPSTTFNSTTTTQTVTGLTNGQSYSFAVAAKNAKGTSPHSNQTAPITIGVPKAPSSVNAVPLSGSAKVVWIAPTNVNGFAITGYEITPYINNLPQVPTTFNSVLTTQTVSNLIAGKSYTFKVAAINANGKGLASTNSNSVNLLGTSLLWNQLTNWTDAWDAEEAATYTPTLSDQNIFSINSDTRVESIPDRGTSNMPLKREEGHYSSAYKFPSNLPGPKFIDNSSYFGGRNAILFDQLQMGNIYPTLTPNRDWNPENWFNAPTGYTGPYWMAILGDGQDATLGSDGTGPTFGGTIFNNPLWTVGCWGLDLGPISFITLTQPINYADTVMLLYYNSGNGPSSQDSFFEVVTRKTDGSLITNRKYGAQNNYPFKEMFMGWVDGHRYWSASGIKLGTPTETEMTNVRNWGASYIPAGGVRTQ